MKKEVISGKALHGEAISFKGQKTYSLSLVIGGWETGLDFWKKTGRIGERAIHRRWLRRLGSLTFKAGVGGK